MNDLAVARGSGNDQPHSKIALKIKHPEFNVHLIHTSFPLLVIARAMATLSRLNLSTVALMERLDKQSQVLKMTLCLKILHCSIMKV